MEPPVPIIKHTGFKRIFKATGYSLKGLSYAFRNEAAFRQEALAAFILLPLALWLNVTQVERMLLIMAVVLVLVVELLNTGLEAVVDRVGVEYHVLAGVAKDMGSAAVFLSLLFCVYVWASILLTFL
jgi:diacylglycerol kinase (ATP)